MPKIIRIHTGNLKLVDQKLAEIVAKELGSLPNGWTEIEYNQLSKPTRTELLNLLPVLAEIKNPDDAMAQNEIYNKKVAADAAIQSKQIAEKNAAIARLEEYGAQGVVASDKNVREITNFIDSSFDLPEHLRGKWTVHTVDLAIGYLSKEGRLEIEKAEVVAPLPTTPTETLVTLSEGSKQLPLDKPVPRSATVEQAKDYLARLRKAQQPNVTVVPGFKSALR